jgi:outer membrane protein
MNKKSSALFLSLASFVALSTTISCTNKKDNQSNNNQAGMATSGKIAYINVDTLQAKFTFWKTESDALAAEQSQIESELQRSGQQLQNEAAAFQQKAQSGQLSEADGRAAQQKLGQMQQALEARRTTLGEQLQAKQLAFSEKLQKNIDQYLAIYNKDNKYDYIMSYTKSGQILYANKAFDITEDVLKGLNEFKFSNEDSTKTN